MMSEPEVLPIADVEQIVNIVGRAGDPELKLSIPERKRELLVALSKLIEADVWLWSASIPNPDIPGDVMSANMVDGGWESPRQQALVYEALTNPIMAEYAQQPIVEAVRKGRFITFTREEMISDEQWEVARKIWEKTGLDHMLMTVYPINDQAFSGIGFHRRQGRPNFTPRERAIANIVLRQVDWLHRHATDLPINGEVVQLSPRERQVLILLLAGHSKKVIATRMEISEHTVGDYMKRLHRHFAVNSRAQLQAIFHTGNTATGSLEQDDEE